MHNRPLVSFARWAMDLSNISVCLTPCWGPSLKIGLAPKRAFLCLFLSRHWVQLSPCPRSNSCVFFSPRAKLARLTEIRVAQSSFFSPSESPGPQARKPRKPESRQIEARPFAVAGASAGHGGHARDQEVEPKVRTCA